MPESASCHPLFRIRDNGIVEVLDGREKGKKFELRSRQSAFQTKAFPLGCRLFSKTSTGKTFYLCEFPPSVRDVAWIPLTERDGSFGFRLKTNPEGNSASRSPSLCLR